MFEELVRQGEECVKKGDVVTLEQIIRTLSKVPSSNEYLYLSAYLQFLKGRLSKALELCEKIEPSFRKGQSQGLICKALLLKATILRREGEYTNSNRTLDRCFKVIQGDTFMLGDIWNSKGVNFWMLGKFEKAKQCYRKARYLSQRSKEMSVFLKSSINLGIVPLHQGHFFEADVYLRNALELCEKEQEKRLRIYALLNLGELCWKKGDWKLGKELLAGCKESAIEFSLTYEEGASYWILANILRDGYNFEEAYRVYNRALELLEKSMSYTEKLYVYLNMGVLERLRGNYQTALNLLNRAQTIMEQTGEKLDEGILLIETGMVLWFLRERQSSLKYLNRGIAKTKNRKYERTIGELFRFYIRKQRGSEDAKLFDGLLRRCWKYGYDTILLRERQIFLPLLCEYLLMRKRSTLPKMILFRLVTNHEELINFLLEHRSVRCQEVALSAIEKLGLGHLKSKVQNKIWALRPRIAHKAVAVLETLEQKPLPSLAIKLFGKFEITKDDDTLLSLSRKKMKDLLKILILYYRKPILREQLMEMLWPGEVPEKSFNSLRQLIFLLRRAFDEFGFNGSAVIHHETGLYEFRYPAQRLEVDLFRFHDEIKNGDLLFNSGREDVGVIHYNTAIELYRGPLLSENLYDAWVEVHRLNARDMYRRVVLKACDFLRGRDPEKAEAIFKKACYTEPELRDYLSNHL